MTTSRLTARLDKVAQQLDPQHSMVVQVEEGETAEEAMKRAGVTWAVAVMPLPCRTNEEWLLMHAPHEGKS